MAFYRLSLSLDRFYAHQPVCWCVWIFFLTVHDSLTCQTSMNEPRHKRVFALFSRFAFSLFPFYSHQVALFDNGASFQARSKDDMTLTIDTKGFTFNNESHTHTKEALRYATKGFTFDNESHTHTKRSTAIQHFKKQT